MERWLGTQPRPGPTVDLRAAKHGPSRVPRYHHRDGAKYAMEICLGAGSHESALHRVVPRGSGHITTVESAE